MKISRTGFDLIKSFEGCHLSAYKCPAGRWTIGYGHTEGVTAGMKISQAQAEAYFLAEMGQYEKRVEKYDQKYHWTQPEFDALVSFAYNVGSIDELTEKGTRTKAEIAEVMLSYNTAKVNGVKKVLPGLTRRREAERKMFLSGAAPGAAAKKPDAGSEKPEMGGVREFSRSKDGSTAVSKNFQVREFACKDGSDKILIDTTFVRDKLQKIRDHFGVSITVNSGYRTPEYNKKVGGAAKSYHMEGRAFDIVVKGRAPQEVARYAASIGITGVIQYNSFTHVDSRDTKYWARNDNGKVTVKDGF